MAIKYQISTWNHFTAPKAFDYSERYRRDAALDELWRQIFEMISGNAGRDTKRGWQLKREFEDFAKDVESGLKQGYYRHKVFYWRADGGNGEYVDFWQQRVRSK